MNKYLTALLISLLLIGACIATTPAVEAESEYRIGIQHAFPAEGLSLMIDFTEHVSTQAILGLIGDLKTCAGRGIYRFNTKPNGNQYCYGMLGIWTHPTYIVENYSLKETIDSAIGFGAGVGMEYRFKGGPPLIYNIEIGFGKVEFEQADYEHSAIEGGIGFHYKF